MAERHARRGAGGSGGGRGEGTTGYGRSRVSVGSEDHPRLPGTLFAASTPGSGSTRAQGRGKGIPAPTVGGVGG